MPLQSPPCVKEGVARSVTGGLLFGITYLLECRCGCPSTIRKNRKFLFPVILSEVEESQNLKLIHRYFDSVLVPRTALNMTKTVILSEAEES